MDDDLDLLLPLLFIVADDCVVIKEVGDLRVGYALLELLYLRLLLLLLEEVLLLDLEEEENPSIDHEIFVVVVVFLCVCRCCDDEDVCGNDLDLDLVERWLLSSFVIIMPPFALLF